MQTCIVVPNHNTTNDNSDNENISINNKNNNNRDNNTNNNEQCKINPVSQLKSWPKIHSTQQTGERWKEKDKEIETSNNKNNKQTIYKFCNASVPIPKASLNLIQTRNVCYVV